MQAVDTIEKDEQGLHVFLQWNNGKKSKHPIEQTYKKCPEKVSPDGPVLPHST